MKGSEVETEGQSKAGLLHRRDGGSAAEISPAAEAGPFSKRKLSDIHVEEKEKLAEAKIKILQKQFRMVVEEKKSYIANIRHKIQVQQEKIKSVNEEYPKEPLTLLQLISLRNETLDNKTCMELQYLLQTKDQHESLIRDRKVLLVDLNNQVLELEKKVKQKQVTVKVKHVKCNKILQKRIETLEQNLNNVTVHFNTILTRKNELQGEIKSLHTQKAVLDNNYVKLRKKLDQQLRRMNIAIEQSAEANKNWTKYLAKISHMKEKHNKDTVQFNSKMQEWNRLLDQHVRQNNFMLTKSRNLSELEEQAKEKKALKEAEQLKQSKNVSHEVAHRLLKEVAEDGNILQLVNGILDSECKNLSFVSYAIKMNGETYKMQKMIKDNKNDITTILTDQECAESSNVHILRELEEKLTEATEETREYQERFKQSSKALGQIKSDLEDLCKEIDSNSKKMIPQLRRAILELNLTQFSGLEEKTKELLMLESILRYTLAKAEILTGTLAEPFANPLLRKVKDLQVTDQAQFCPGSPSMDDNYDTDTFDVLLDYSQIYQMALQRLREKQEQRHQHREERSSFNM